MQTALAGKYHLDIKQFCKTIEGADIVRSGHVFILGGQVWQGYRDVAVKVDDDQLSEKEFRDAIDTDGSKAQVRGRMKAKAATLAKEVAKERAQRISEQLEAQNREAEAFERIDQIRDRDPERAASMQRNLDVVLGRAQEEEPEAEPEDPETPEPEGEGAEEPELEEAHGGQAAIMRALNKLQEGLDRVSTRVSVIEGRRGKKGRPRRRALLHDTGRSA